MSEYGFIFPHNRSQHYPYLSGSMSGNVFLSGFSKIPARLHIFLVLLYLILRKQTLIYQECVQSAIQQVVSLSQLETTQRTMTKIQKNPYIMLLVIIREAPHVSSSAFNMSCDNKISKSEIQYLRGFSSTVAWKNFFSNRATN